MQARRQFKAPHHTRDELVAGLELASELVDPGVFTEAERLALLPVVFNHVMAAHIQFEVVAGGARLLGGERL